MAHFESQVGSKLLSKSGEVDIGSCNLGDKEIVGLYFSAHWCPPCRGFTPVLVDCYTELKEKDDKKFEVIFVTLDRDEDSFNGYFGDMPWLAVPFADKATREKLGSKYGVRGIPCLVLLDSSGTVITKEGRELVSKGPGSFSTWKTKCKK